MSDSYYYRSMRQMNNAQWEYDHMEPPEFYYSDEEEDEKYERETEECEDDYEPVEKDVYGALIAHLYGDAG